MGAGDAEALAVLARVSSDFDDLCRSIGDQQWSISTPCAEWNLGTLVEHVVGGNRFTVLILDGATAEQAMTETVRSFETLQDQRAAARESIGTQLRAFDEPDVLDRICHHLAGELTGREVLRIRLHELIIHTWDMAEALNPPASIRDEYVAWSFAEIADPDSNTVEIFALDTEALVDGSTEHSLLAAFGRASSK